KDDAALSLLVLCLHLFEREKNGVAGRFRDLRKLGKRNRLVGDEEDRFDLALQFVHASASGSAIGAPSYSSTAPASMRASPLPRFTVISPKFSVWSTSACPRLISSSNARKRTTLSILVVQSFVISRKVTLLRSARIAMTAAIASATLTRIGVICDRSRETTGFGARARAAITARSAGDTRASRSGQR